MSGAEGRSTIVSVRFYRARPPAMGRVLPIRLSANSVVAPTLKQPFVFTTFGELGGGPPNRKGAQTLGGCFDFNVAEHERLARRAE